jgi:hypothetical protein
MTDPTPPAAEPAGDSPAPTPAPAKPSPPSAARPAAPGSVLRVLTAAGFLCVAIALFVLWERITGLEGAAPDTARIASLDSQLHDLQQRLAALEQRPVTAPPRPTIDLRPLEGRVAALEARPATAAPAPPPDLAPIEARLAAAERLARIVAAGRALDAGEPLGPLPGAPPALARFATAAPPTLASLRTAFLAAAGSARAASRPAAADGWAERLRQGLAGLVTLRSGNTVLIGTPATATLVAAEARLDAGDLQGALDALAPLDPAAATAMAPWRDQTQSLLDARAALAAMAHG